ncbi:hypothetical protein [Pseudomonas typographi]|uniref:Uncharacterized protein n=1 Tax=Pseudomonas typographi TaxID=2715964 RepID=A0ABR7Z9W0_9PSED|nr:hypothetical protein [Pseudomonas typographi]MBD1602094.1 hypothetical protein [Pseudomonas typographi]
MNEHIHTPGDGRGRRLVYVNGNAVDGVVWADTKRGIVRYMPKPYRVKRPGGDEVYTRTLRGHVTVVPMEDGP